MRGGVMGVSENCAGGGGSGGGFGRWEEVRGEKGR